MENINQEVNQGSDVNENGNFVAPKIIKQFSKETNLEERTQTARDIRIARSERRQELSEGELETEKNEKKIVELKGKVEKIDSAFWAKLPLLNKLAENLTSEDKAEIERIDQEVADSLPKTGRFKAKDPREMLEEFYQKEEERWKKSDFEREDVEKYFTEENLSAMDMDEYLLLLSRFNTEFSTHVTRQGIRDHVGMSGHIAGQGEFWHGFEDILKDGRLKSSFSNMLTQENKELALAEYLQWYIDQFTEIYGKNENESDRQVVENVLNRAKEKGGHAGSYSDSVALHLGVKCVLDSFYGGEHGNELFFLHPMAYIVNNYHVYQEGSSEYETHNNLWVWDQEHKGLAINTGIVCIPAESKVNPDTGSKYELDKNGQPIVMEENVTILAELLDSDEFNEFVKLSFESLYESGDWSKQDEKKKEIDTALETRFGIKDPEARSLIIHDGYVKQRIDSHYLKYDFIPVEARDLASRILSENACYYKKAENTISSKAYWEKYFQEHPDLKPNKIYYYNGSPNYAVQDLKHRHKLDKYGMSKSETLFEDKYSYGNEEEGSPGYDEFQDLAKKVLDKYFPI